MKNEAIIAAVVALLKGIEVDGETMEYIINETHMTDQIKEQLGVSTNTLPEEVIEQIARDVYDNLDNTGTDILSSYELEMYNNSVEIDRIDLDSNVVIRAVRETLTEHFTPME